MVDIVNVKFKVMVMLLTLITLITFNSINVFALNEDELSTKEKIVNNMQKKSEESKKNDMKRIGELGKDNEDSKPIESIDEFVDNATTITENIFISILEGISEISVYIAILSVIIGIIGCVFTRNAPMLRKWFIGIMIAGPLVFLLSTYGPVVYFNFSGK